MKTKKIKSGVELIAEERQRQISQEGWTSEHDDQHIHRELSRAGACYALPKGMVHVARMLNSARGMEAAGYSYDYSQPDSGQITWPFDGEWYKPSNDPIRNLAKAGALIAAEIDRLQRKGSK